MCVCIRYAHLSVWKCVRQTHTQTHRVIGCRKQYGPLREGMGECVLSTTAINYKALGLHVLIRGINVSSFPLHTPPFASFNAAGERKSVRASERERSCPVLDMEEVRARRMAKNKAEKRTFKQHNQ